MRGRQMQIGQKTLALVSFLTIISGCSNRIESSHGSTVVCIAARDYVVCAADSRGTDALKSKPKNDSACKIIALGADSLFVNTGFQSITSIRGNSWDSLATARTVFKESATNDTRTLANTWSKDASTWFGGLRNVDFQTLTNNAKTKGPITLVTGGFMGFTKDGLLTVQAQDIDFDFGTHKVTQEPTFNFVPGVVQEFIFGVARDLAGEFLDGQTPRAQKASLPVPAPRPVGGNVDHDVDTAKRAVQFVIDNATGQEKDTVGGPIDIVILRKGGIQWKDRKTLCYFQDLVTEKKQ